MKINFHKMQANLNDFIIINENLQLDAEQIKHLCDRRAGIGADQLLIISANNSYFCKIYNSDGSESYQCGNGLRCVAKFLAEQDKVSNIIIKTKAGDYNFTISGEEIECNMGQPIFAPQSIPLQIANKSKTYQGKIKQQNFNFSAVNIGNPHMVIFTNDENLPQEEIFQTYSSNGVFPEGVNVGFVSIINKDNVTLQVYERGVGATPSCGSGATAAAVCGILLGKLNPELTIKQDGGSSKVKWQGINNDAYLIGNCHYSFCGFIDI